MISNNLFLILNIDLTSIACAVISNIINAKFKYINKESRDLQFFDYDARFRLNLNKVNITLGGSVKGHPIYGHPAIWDYDGVWFELAWDYGYEDFIHGIRPETTEDGQLRYTLVDGVFKTMCEAAKKDSNNKFVIIVDEINRGSL